MGKGCAQCVQYHHSLVVRKPGLRHGNTPGLPYSDSNVDLEFGRAVQTSFPNLRFRNPLELMDLVMSDALTSPPH